MLHVRKKTTDWTSRGLAVTHGAAVNCCHAKQRAAASEWTPIMIQSGPSPHMPQAREGPMRTSRQIIIYASNAREPRREAKDSELRYPRLAATPLFLPQLSVLQRQRRGREREGGGREEKKKVERFIPFFFSSLSLCLSRPLSLVPPFLNLTIKQHCKNRMFLAGAQQWQSREGTRPYVKKKKKTPLFSSLSPKKRVSNVQVMVLKKKKSLHSASWKLKARLVFSHPVVLQFLC